DLKTHVDEAHHDVEEDWTALNAAVTKFLEKLHEEQEALTPQAAETLQHVGEAQQAVATDGAQAKNEIDQGKAQLDGLGQHATGLEAGMETLATARGPNTAQSV